MTPTTQSTATRPATPTAPPPGALSPTGLAGFTARALIVLGLVGLAALCVLLADVAVLVFGGVIVAVALRAGSVPLARRTGLGERAALGLLLVLLAAALVTLVVLLGEPVTQELTLLREALPDALDAAGRWLTTHPIGLALLELWQTARGGAEGAAAASSVPWSRLAGWAAGTMTALGSAVLLMFVGVYVAMDPRLYRRGLLRLLPVRHRPRVDAALSHAGGALKSWLLGQSISMLAIGSLTAIGLAWLGMPQALALGVIAGLLTFVPYFGAIAAGVLIVLLSFTQGASMALKVALLVLAVQQFDGFVVEPAAQRWAVALPPVLSMVAVLIFGLLFGLLGAVFAVPLMVVVKVLVERLYVQGVVESGPG